MDPVTKIVLLFAVLYAGALVTVFLNSREKRPRGRVRAALEKAKRGGVVASVACLLGLLLSSTAWAYEVPPKPDVPVYDGADVLTPEHERELVDKLTTFKKQHGPEVALAIIPTLGEDDINDVRYEIFNAWGIGDKERKDGILLLFVADKAKGASPGADRCGCAAIEVGEYVESVWTDTQSVRILRDQVLEPIVKGDFHGAATAGLDAIMGTLSGDAEAARDYKNDSDAGGTTEKKDDGDGWDLPWWVWLIGIAVLVILQALGVPVIDIVLTILMMGGGRGGGGGGGGGSSFGGGGSSGGGGGSI